MEVRRGFSPQLVLNQLYKSTRLQLRFSTNMVRQLDSPTVYLQSRSAPARHFVVLCPCTVSLQQTHQTEKAAASYVYRES